VRPCIQNLSSLSIMQQNIDSIASLEACVHLKTLWVVECQVEKIAGLGRGLHSPTSQLNVSTFCGIRWVPSVDRRFINRHNVDTQRLTDHNGLRLS
jgi:hypothetical protein